MVRPGRLDALALVAEAPLHLHPPLRVGLVPFVLRVHVGLRGRPLLDRARVCHGRLQVGGEDADDGDLEEEGVREALDGVEAEPGADDVEDGDVVDEKDGGDALRIWGERVGERIRGSGVEVRPTGESAFFPREATSASGRAARSNALHIRLHPYWEG